jgi:two-component system, NtrC family, response regulator AtoC
MASILVIEDELILAKNVCDALRFDGHDASTVRTGEEGIEIAESESPDLVLLDYRLPGIDGLSVLNELSRRAVPAAVVMMTAHGNIETAVAAMKAGAVDFVTKPLDLKELQLLINRVLETRRLRGELQYFRERERASGSLDQILGESKSIDDVKKMILKLVSTPALAMTDPPSILITGETGTGKDLIARAIHYAGPRKDGPFVHVNCTALPEHLVEAELFGHVKGAFTDARADKRGLLECAENGTAFLDEIGHMPASLQAKLLQSIEHRTIRPVGGTKDRKINVLFIAATNRDIEEAISQRDFRDDLYHRLRTLSIHLAPLRERGDDALLLAHHFIDKFAARFGIGKLTISNAAADIIAQHDWPGNVRELAHVLESAVVMVDGTTVTPDHLNVQLATASTDTTNIQVAGGKTIALDFSGDCPTLEEIEFQIIEAAVEHSKHNLTRAARVLGISRDAVRYRMERFKKRKSDGDAT